MSFTIINSLSQVPAGVSHRYNHADALLGDLPLLRQSNIESAAVFADSASEQKIRSILADNDDIMFYLIMPRRTELTDTTLYRQIAKLLSGRRISAAPTAVESTDCDYGTAIPDGSLGDSDEWEAECCEIELDNFDAMLLASEAAAPAPKAKSGLFGAIGKSARPKKKREPKNIPTIVTEKRGMTAKPADCCEPDFMIHRQSFQSTMPAAAMPSLAGLALEDALRKLDAGFSDTLLQMIERTGKKDSDIYKAANVDRRLFSKIRSNPNYQPSKATAIAFAIALHLDMAETRELIGRAGFALNRSSTFDIIITHCIENHIYDIYSINQTLYTYDQPLLGAA